MTALQNGDAGLNAIAKVYWLPNATLKRHLDSGNKYANGSKKFSGRPQTLPPELEAALVKCVLDMESMLTGLSRTDLMELAYQLADVNGIDGFKHGKQSASTMWYRKFMKRHPELSLRKAEATSVARAKGFNRINVGELFYSLETLVDKHNLGPASIYNGDESGITTVQKPGKVIGRCDKKQVGSLTSGEHGFTTTVVCCVSAAGNYIPPMMIYKRRRLSQTMQVGAPPETVLERSDSGWMTKELFLVWIQHFHSHVKWSPDKPGLLILDGHYSHTRNLEAIDFARENGITLLSLPPHTTHRLRPLDRTFYKSLMVNYDRACDKWLRTEKTTVRVDVIAKIFGEAYVASATMSTAISGFRCTGIWPCDRHVFTDEDYAATSRFGDPSAQAPGDPPAQAPGDQPAQAPGDQPAQAPNDQPAKPPGDQPAQAPGEQPAQAPGDQPAQAPGEQPAQSPGDQPAQAPGDQPAQAPGDPPAQAPGDQPAQAPNDQPAQAPGDQPAQAPGDPPEQAPGDQPSSVIITCADGRCFFRSVVISLDVTLQTATRDHYGNLTHIMSRIVETNEADSLRAKVVRYMCEHFDDYRHIDKHAANADLPEHKHYGSIEERTEAMAKQTEMVGEIEIIATTKSLQRTIEVFVDTSKIVYGREFSATKLPIRLQFLAGVNDAGHYNCIIPGNTFITPQILSPVRNFNHQQRGLTTRSEILTSSPY